jgi:hypothetical protein
VGIKFIYFATGLITHLLRFRVINLRFTSKVWKIIKARVMVQQKSKGYVQQGCSIPLIHERVKMGESGGVSKLGRRV